MEFLIVLIVGAIIAFIPANIAKKKGHSYGLWWFYGWMLFIVAIIHVQFIEDRNSPKYIKEKSNLNISVAEELRKYKDLLDEGVITEDEFEAKKKQLLNMV